MDESSGRLFDGARSIVGERFAEARVDPDRGLRVTVIDLDDDDVSAITTLAQRLGIEDWVRMERADPAALEAWERLRHDLIRLRDFTPGVLHQYPGPDPGYRRPPVGIDLAATPEAEAEAAHLHAEYGEFVDLHVGALPYPPQPKERPSTRQPAEVPTPIDSAGMHVRLDTPLSVRRGDTGRSGLLVTNLTNRGITISTNGQITASIIDPATGATVGGFTGFQRMPLITFTAAPAETVRIPLLVGTTSYSPRLGYSLPAGTWQLTALLHLLDGRQLTTEPLDFTITD